MVTLSDDAGTTTSPGGYTAISSITPQVTVTAPATIASPAQGLIATSPLQGSGTLQAKLQGSVNPDGAATTVEFIYGTDPTLTTGTTTVTADTDVLGTSPVYESYILTGLSQNTTYYFEEVANNIKGTTYGSIESFTSTPLPIPAGTQTTAASYVAATLATVNGTVNPNGLPTTVTFVYGTAADLLTGYGTDPNPAASAQSVTAATGLANTGVDYATFNLTGLAQNTTYYFVELSANTAGTTIGSVQSFTTGTLFTANTSADLVSAIQSANSTPGNDEIDLASGGDYQFTTANDSTVGPTALPAVTGTLLIVGNGSTIERTGSTAMRLLYVESTGTLIIENLTLQGGLAQGGNGGDQGGGGAAGLGGAIWNDGALTLVNSTLANNQAQGGAGGGAIFGDSVGVPANSGGGGGGIGGNGTDGSGYPGNAAVFTTGASGGGPNGAAGGAGGMTGSVGSTGGEGGGGGGGGEATVTGGAGGVGGLGGGGGGGGSGSDGTTYYIGVGGAGGFGGGGGGGGLTAGAGGFAGGDGSAGVNNGIGGGSGGGGGGLGGAIFNNGGTLTITSSTLTANTAAGGRGQRRAGPGRRRVQPATAR